MEVPNIYQKEFIRKSTELGFTLQEESDNSFRLNLNKGISNTIVAKLIGSEPIIERNHGTKNNTEIKAIGYFLFKLPSEGKEPDFYIFEFSNKPNNQVEFVIIPYPELKKRLDLRNRFTNNDLGTELVLWLMPDNFVFETTNIGEEGEWWFIGGRMAENTNWDYTSYLNRWGELYNL